MFSLVRKAAPYALLVLFGTTLIVSIGQVFWGPKAPVEMTATEIESTAPEHLPGWVVANDATPFWMETVSIFREKGGFKIYDRILVPIVSPQLKERWGTFKPGGKTLVVAQVSFDELRNKWPRLASALSGGAALEAGDSLPEFSPINLTFDAFSGDVATGFARETIQNWMTQNGFTDHAIVGLNKKPPTMEESVVNGVGALAFSAGCVFWIKRRRRKSRERDVLGGYSAGVSSAASQVVSEGVSRAQNGVQQSKD